jgi:hypothetical protein
LAHVACDKSFVSHLIGPSTTSWVIGSAGRSNALRGRLVLDVYLPLLRLVVKSDCDTIV